MKITGNMIVVSGSGGAILGGSVFGPIGAVIGAVAGATVGLIASDDEGDNKRPKRPQAKETISSIVEKDHVREYAE